MKIRLAILLVGGAVLIAPSVLRAQRGEREITRLVQLASNHFEAREWEEAGRLHQRALELKRSSFGPRDESVAACLTALGHIRYKQGRIERAEQLLENAISILEAGEADSLVYARALNGLGRVRYEQWRFSEAQDLFERSLQIRREMLPPDHRDIAEGINDLAAVQQALGRLTEAEAMLEEALRIRGNTLGFDHPDYAQTLNNLAVVQHKLGRYDAVESMLERALAIWESTARPDDVELARTRRTLSRVLMDRGRLPEAETLLARTVRDLDASDGTARIERGQALDALAVLYTEQGRYDAADSLFAGAAEALEEGLGPDHPELAITLRHWAWLRVVQGRPSQAESLYRSSLDKLEAMLGADTREVAHALNDLGALLRSLGRLPEAEELLLHAYRVREAVLGADHPDVAVSSVHLGDLYADLDRLAEAESRYDRAIEILEAVPIYPEMRISAYLGRGRLHKKRGSVDEAMRDLAEGLEQVERLRPLSGGDERTRSEFFVRFSEDFDRMVDWLLSDQRIEDAFEYAERARARVLLDQLSGAGIDIRNHIEPEGRRRELLAMEESARARMAEYHRRITVLSGRSEPSELERDARMNALRDSLRQSERAYARAYAQIKNASMLWRDHITRGGKQVALSTVQRRLVPRDGLLLLYQIGPDASWVFVIPERPETPRAFRLSVTERSARALDLDPGPLAHAELVRVLGSRREASGDDQIGFADRGPSRGLGLEKGRETFRSRVRRLHALWEVLVPESIRARVMEAAEVALILDDQLHSVPFEALVVNPGAGTDPDPSSVRYWLDEGPAITYAPSASIMYNLLERPDAGPAGRPAGVLSLSNPVYDPGRSRPEGRDDESRRDRDPDLERGEETLLVSALPPLPGTARETDAILAAFGGHRTLGEFVALQGLNATEEQLRREIGGKRYIHLATHGRVDPRRSSLFATLVLTVPAEGTVTAGNDGLLQLHEIYDFDLLSSDLAVLSACESNVGESVEAEGVFALSRGFLASGSRRVIASQWSVNDDSTARIMGEFFDAIAEAERSGRGLDYAVALRDAKRTVRQNPQWSDPYYWAPFVLTGAR
ncbi:MAG: CHAT domain-containing tetratricopeptide repeat protein [Gemmatimonadota bacterium]|nr:CHAT domain-containing tetratricopeptide repeat protein [Gemmatimonadota bacterium]